MSNLDTSPKLYEKETYSSQSSDEKMDTGSESFLSTQNTPNSILSSDFEDNQNDFDNKSNDVLRLQEPIENCDSQTNPVLRLSRPTANENNYNSSINKLSNVSLNDSLITKMTNLTLNSVDTEDHRNNRPKHLGISPPKSVSTLTSTTNHPLMGLGSPDSVENFPDVIPEKIKRNNLKIEDESHKDLSLSSAEENNIAIDSTGYLEFYEDGPQRNTSKNNLYFSENFTTSEINVLNGSNTSPPDVARVHAAEQKTNESSHQRRKIISRFRESEICHSTPKQTVSPQMIFGHVIAENGTTKYVEERDRRVPECTESTPRKGAEAVDIPVREDMHSGVAEWCESPSHLRSLPNFELPIEMSSSLGMHNDLESPDVLSSSSQEDRSQYQALLDPYSGSVALRHTPNKVTHPTNCIRTSRRKIVAIVQTDTEERCSLDSESVCSLHSEEVDELPPEDREVEIEEFHSISGNEQSLSDDDSRRNSQSEYSEPIPEYSATEERYDERAWLKVALPTGGYSSCDMKVIEPYKRVLSHGGYDAAGSGCAIIVFSACHLPDCARADYNYVMDNLFLYVLWTLERLVTEEYLLVYLHGSAHRRRMPTFHWLHECYKLIDRRLRKNLKHLYLVHPTFWIKSIVLLSKPFVSSKFSRKISYVKSLKELMERVPVEPNAIPDLVRDYDSLK